ncbi:MAG: methyltransferase [Planctomycetaceae bacterium]|nr:methyltransferase [Planctomycetaceae bacterium]
MPRRVKLPKRHNETPSAPRIRPQERLLIDVVSELPAGRLLCNTSGRGQFARAYAAAHPTATATCWFLDIYQRDQAEAGEESSPNLSFVCTSDPPAAPVDLVAWALGRRGESELTREMLQTGYDRLELGGRMVASTDKEEDQWLHDELKKFFPKVTRRPFADGVLYLATKTEPLDKLKQYDCEFAFRDAGRLIYAYSRPSVFSHRRLDGGARTLLNTMTITPGLQVLDLGCGSGAVGLAALCRADNVHVLAVDSNPRALECALRGAAKNGLTGLDTALDASGDAIPTEAFDLVLANPPYFSHYRIAELFLHTAYRALQPGGLLTVVTKAPAWFVEEMPKGYDDVGSEFVKDYAVVTGRRPR